MWMTMLLAAPVVHAQEAWSDAQYKARMAQMEGWYELYVKNLVFVATGDDRYAGLGELNAELESYPRMPGRDFALDAAFAANQRLGELAEEHHRDQQVLRADKTPRDDDQLRCEATFKEVVDAGFQALEVVEQGDAKTLLSYDIRLIPQSYTTYQDQTLGLPGPSSSLPLVIRQNFAIAHANELFVLVQEARKLATGSMNEGVSAEELSSVQERFGELLRRAEAVPPWMGSDTMVVAVRRELRDLHAWSLHELPQMVQARDVQRSAEAYNVLVQEFNGRHAENLRRYAVALEAFSGAWKIEDASAVERSWSNYRKVAAAVGVERPEIARFKALQGLQLAYQQLTFDMEARLLQGDEPQEVKADLVQELAALDAELSALEDPEYQDDPYHAQILALSELVHWKVEDVAVNGPWLLVTPRDEDQVRWEAIYHEENERTADVLAALQTAQAAYAQRYDVKLIHQDEDTPAPTEELHVLSFPGPDSSLPDLVRASMAYGHSQEVWATWEQSEAALSTILQSPSEQWRRVTLKQQPLIDQALADAQQIPPWMGDSTLVDGTVEALGILSAAMNDHWPTVLLVLDDPGFRSRRASRRAMATVEARYDQAAELLNDSYARFAERWHLELIDSEGE